MAKKTSVQFYYEYIEQLKDLDDKQFRNVLEAMVEYDETGEIAELEPITKMAFSFIKKRIDYDKDSYNKKCEKNKQNIQKYWDSKKQTNTNVYERIPMNTKNTDIELELDIDNNKKENIKRKKFIKPTVQEIQKYCEERNNGINAEAFFDFYESKNWYVGKNKMIDWKACIRTWEKRNTKEKPKYNDGTSTVDWSRVVNK